MSILDTSLPTYIIGTNVRPYFNIFANYQYFLIYAMEASPIFSVIRNMTLMHANIH